MLRSFFSGNTKFISIGIIVVLLIALGLTVYILQQQQNLRQEAAENDPSVLVTVYGEPITREDVLAYADTMYKTTPSDNAALKPMLDELIEQRILQRAAQENNLTVTDAEIDSYIAREGLLGYKDYPAIRNTAQKAVLKRKIERLFTKYREAYTVGFWVPPEDYDSPIPEDSVALVEQQREDAPLALAQILAQLEDGEEPLTVAQQIMEEYPSLEGIMAVNGYIVSQEQNELLMTEPVLYSYQGGRAHLPLFETMFSLQPGEIVLVEDTENTSGGNVVKIIEAGDGQFDNYSSWYWSVRPQSLTVVNNL